MIAVGRSRTAHDRSRTYMIAVSYLQEIDHCARACCSAALFHKLSQLRIFDTTCRSVILKI
jgi:hypothetical protein